MVERARVETMATAVTRFATTLEPIRRDSTAERIAERLRDGILVGTLSPGQRLREVEIARQLQVSRGPVREAFQRLIQEGLLEARPARGVVVAHLTGGDIADVYLAREALESAAARHMAAEGTPATITSLQHALDNLKHAPASDWAALVRRDLEWHLTLVQGSKSKRLVRMFQTLSAETQLCMFALEPFYPDRDEMVAEHGEIVAAIVEGDATRAVDLVERHMHDSVERLAGGAAART